MADDPDLEAAWDLVWESLPAHFQLGLPSFDRGRQLWSVSAIDGRTIGRGRLARSVNGLGESPAEALRDLDASFRGERWWPDGTRIEELRRRARLAYIQGAEEWARDNGRPLSADELVGVVRRFSGS